jgi:hypothetical protein
MGSVSRVIGMIPGMAKVWTSIWTILNISIYYSFMYLVPSSNWEQRKQLCATSLIGSYNWKVIVFAIFFIFSYFYSIFVNVCHLICMLAGYSCSNSRSREEFAEYGSDNRSNDPWFFLYTNQCIHIL